MATRTGHRVEIYPIVVGTLGAVGKLVEVLMKTNWWDSGQAKKLTARL